VIQGVPRSCSTTSERLARHVHAAVDTKAGALPGGDAAVKDRHVRIAEVGHPLGGPLSQATAVVTPHNACPASRHHVVSQHLNASQRHARSHENVAFPERLFFAGIEESDFEPVVQRCLEGPHVDALDRTRHRFLLLQGTAMTNRPM